MMNARCTRRQLSALVVAIGGAASGVKKTERPLVLTRAHYTRHPPHPSPPPSPRALAALTDRTAQRGCARSARTSAPPAPALKNDTHIFIEILLSRATLVPIIQKNKKKHAAVAAIVFFFRTSR
jgi:hypothetical protein